MQHNADDISEFVRKCNLLRSGEEAGILFVGTEAEAYTQAASVQKELGGIFNVTVTPDGVRYHIKATRS